MNETSPVAPLGTGAKVARMVWIFAWLGLGVIVLLLGVVHWALSDLRAQRAQVGVVNEATGQLFADFSVATI